MNDPKEQAPKEADAAGDRRFSVEELTQRNVETVLALEKMQEQKGAPSEHLSDAISKFCGSMNFVWVHLIWFSGWIIANLMVSKAFDPYPFPFLTLCVSLEAIFLSTFIMISQSRASRISEKRNHLDLQINLLSEQENTKMLRMLLLIGKQVGADLQEDPDIQRLQQHTHPEKLEAQIDQALKDKEGKQKV